MNFRNIIDCITTEGHRLVLQTHIKKRPYGLHLETFTENKSIWTVDNILEEGQQQEMLLDGLS